MQNNITRCKNEWDNTKAFCYADFCISTDHFQIPGEHKELVTVTCKGESWNRWQTEEKERLLYSTVYIQLEHIAEP